MAARIRPARPRDAFSLARMRYAFRAEANATAETEAHFIKRCHSWMKKQIHMKNAWRCWIAERGGRLLGNIWVQLIEKMPNPVAEPELHAYITNFYVIPEVRGRQVGGKLLRAAVNWCGRNKVDAIILWPSPASQSLYLRHGFTRGDDIFELRRS
jgi:GNAT superfamily N-acetyltransferase